VPDAVAREFVALQQAVIGRYSLERELGRGGMGIVFLARDVALDRPVAIKLLPPALTARPGLRDRFLREARTAAKLSQPNIVPVHAVEEAGDLVFFVMGFIDGETLGERLRARGPLTPHEAGRLLQEVAWALGYAHGRGVIHRDIKPDNIMLERGSGRAIVMDFGIAAAADEAAGTEIFGTAQYISPEQANGDALDGRSDLYSLGVVAFLALTGRLPFEATDLATLMAMHMTRPAPPVLAVSPGLPRKLAQAVDRCLAKAPADRFPDGEALAEAVGAAIEQRRELPVPVRLWLASGSEGRVGYLLWIVMAGPSISMALGSLVGRMTSPLIGLVTGVATYAGTPLLIHGGHRLHRLRRLLSAGYTVDDARLAVRDHAEKRREELTYEYGGHIPPLARALHKVMMVSGIAFLGSIASLFFFGRVPEPIILVVAGSGATWFLSAVTQVIRPGRPRLKDVNAERRLKFWNSRFARWFEKLARIGLKRSSAPAALTYRPTEMAIGLAADALFDSLPKEQRRELKALPSVLQRLQDDAALMRRTVDELNQALAGLGERGDAARSSALASESAGSAGVVLGDARAKLRADLTVKRDEAGRRLADAVAALENVRLSLLRLKAGTGTVGDLTEDLTAAQALASAMDTAADARDDVEAFLRRERASGALPGAHAARPADIPSTRRGEPDHA